VSFLGVGYQELLLVLVLMLVVVGPERLPGMAYQIGKAVRTLQGYARQVRDEFQDEISYIEEQYKTVKGEVDTARDSMRAETSRFNTEMRDATAVLRNDPLAVPATSSWVGEVPQNNVVSISDGQPIGPTTDAAETIVESKPEEPKPAPLVF
jgi:sec-independent protein translocase protein TatB